MSSVYRLLMNWPGNGHGVHGLLGPFLLFYACELAADGVRLNFLMGAGLISSTYM